MNDDDVLFVEEDNEPENDTAGFWKVLIVDDEPEVHAVTRLALSDFVMNDRTLLFLSAYSGEEARRMFRQHDDIAVVLLDVVMEQDDAGLRVAQYIRNDLHNHFTRIILRTGQPGQAPEKDVIINYDINDYKSKTELTAQKLFTVIIASLRSYRDIIVIEEARAGLEKIIDATGDLFSSRSIERFIQGLIQQLASILGGAKNAAYITSAVAVSDALETFDDLYIFAGNGDYSGKEGGRLSDALSTFEYELCQQALKSKKVVFADEHLVAYCKGKVNRGALLFLTGLPRQVNEMDIRLIQKFTENVQIAFDNLLCTNEAGETQKEIVQRLGQALDGRLLDKHHVKRIVAMTEILASLMGMKDNALNMLLLAAPLHDIGNSSVPRALLNKSEALNEEELHQIQMHAEFGYQVFKGSERPAIKLAASLARHHHERWDGQGYPDKIQRNAIPIESRIMAVIDTFDALYNARVYKPSWPLEQVTMTMKDAAGKQFDPAVISVFLEHIDQFVEVQKRYPGNR